MSVSVEDFANYVGEAFAESDRQADLTNSLSVASALIDQKVAKAWRPVPVAVQDQMVKDVALAVYQRSQNNTGQYEAESPNGPIDPLMRVYPILSMYVMGV